MSLFVLLIGVTIQLLHFSFGEESRNGPESEEDQGGTLRNASNRDFCAHACVESRAAKDGETSGFCAYHGKRAYSICFYLQVS